MVDYKKLYIDLYNNLTDLINTLEEIQDESLEKFELSEPSKEDMIYFVKNLKSDNKPFVRLKTRKPLAFKK